MTRAPGVEVPAFETLDEAVAILRVRGLRLSSARRTLLIGLFAVDRLVTAEEIATGLDGLVQVSSVAAVYRNLETLEDIGLVRHVHLDHGPGKYVIAAGGAQEYLACERCGKVIATSTAELDPVRDQIRASFGFDTSFEHFPIVGVCAECREIT